MEDYYDTNTAAGASHTGGASIIRNGLKGIFNID